MVVVVGAAAVALTVEALAFEGVEVMVNPPGLSIPGTKTSSHWPGRNYREVRLSVDICIGDVACGRMPQARALGLEAASLYR